MSFGSVSPSLTELDGAVAGYVGAPGHADDAVDIAAGLVVLRGLIDRLELDFARQAARFAATYDECLFFNPSPYSWMRENCHMASGAAVGAVCVGDNVESSPAASPRSRRAASASPTCG